MRKQKETTRTEEKQAITEKPCFITQHFWDAPDEALFTRPEVAAVRRCSVAKLDYEAWRGVGIPVIKDSGRALYRKSDVLGYLASCRAKVVDDKSV